MTTSNQNYYSVVVGVEGVAFYYFIYYNMTFYVDSTNFCVIKKHYGISYYITTTSNQFYYSVIVGIASVSYTHLTLPTIYSV